MYYELIYETGDSSVMCADSDEEALEGIKAAHLRATKGEKSLSSDVNSPPAVRVKRVLVYNEHPGSLYEDGMISASEVKKAVEEQAKGGKVDFGQMTALMRNLADPLINNPSPHESKYHMESTRELDEKEWS